MALVVKNPPASAGDIRNTGSTPGLGRSPGGGHGNPLQDFCLENSMDRGAWRARLPPGTGHRVRHNEATSHTHIMYFNPIAFFLGKLHMNCSNTHFTRQFNSTINVRDITRPGPCGQRLASPHGFMFRHGLEVSGYHLEMPLMVMAWGTKQEAVCCTISAQQWTFFQ